MSDVTVRIGANTAELQGGLQRSRAEVQKFGDQVEQQSKRIKGLQFFPNPDDILKGQKKVQGATADLARGLINAQSAGDALASSLESVTAGLKLGIVGGAAAAIGVTLVSKLIEAQDAARAFDEAIREIGTDSGGASSRGLGEFESRITSIREKLKEMQTDKGWLSNAVEAVRQSFADAWGGQTVGEKKDDQHAQLMQELEVARNNVAKKMQQANEIASLKFQGKDEEADLLKIQYDYEEKIGKAISQQNNELVKQLKFRQQLEEAAARQTATDKRLNADVAEYNAQNEKAEKEQKAGDDAAKQAKDQYDKEDEERAKHFDQMVAQQKAANQKLADAQKQADDAKTEEHLRHAEAELAIAKKEAQDIQDAKLKYAGQTPAERRADRLDNARAERIQRRVGANDADLEARKNRGAKDQRGAGPRAAREASMRAAIEAGKALKQEDTKHRQVMSDINTKLGTIVQKIDIATG